MWDTRWQRRQKVSRKNKALGRSQFSLATKANTTHSNLGGVIDKQIGPKQITEDVSCHGKSAAQLLRLMPCKWLNLSDVTSRSIAHACHALVFAKCIVCGITHTPTTLPSRTTDVSHLSGYWHDCTFSDSPPMVSMELWMEFREPRRPWNAFRQQVS